MLGKLLAAFILIPLVEFLLLVWLAERTSIWATIGLVIITGIVGSLLARAEGLRAWRRFRQAAAEGRLPGREIQDGLMIAFAAALLLTPGLITDTLGFLLLIPYSREKVRAFLARKLAGSMNYQVFSQVRHPDGTVEAKSWSNTGSGGSHHQTHNHYGPVDPDKLDGAARKSRTIDAVGVRTIDQ